MQKEHLMNPVLPFLPPEVKAPQRCRHHTGSWRERSVWTVGDLLWETALREAVAGGRPRIHAIGPVVSTCSRRETGLPAAPTVTSWLHRSRAAVSRVGPLPLRSSVWAALGRGLPTGRHGVSPRRRWLPRVVFNCCVPEVMWLGLLSCSATSLPWLHTPPSHSCPDLSVSCGPARPLPVGSATLGGGKDTAHVTP